METNQSALSKYKFIIICYLISYFFLKHSLDLVSPLFEIGSDLMLLLGLVWFGYDWKIWKKTERNRHIYNFLLLFLGMIVLVCLFIMLSFTDFTTLWLEIKDIVVLPLVVMALIGVLPEKNIKNMEKLFALILAGVSVNALLAGLIVMGSTQIGPLRLDPMQMSTIILGFGVPVCYYFFTVKDRWFKKIIFFILAILLLWLQWLIDFNGSLPSAIVAVIYLLFCTTVTSTRSRQSDHKHLECKFMQQTLISLLIMIFTASWVFRLNIDSAGYFMIASIVAIMLLEYPHSGIVSGVSVIVPYYKGSQYIPDIFAAVSENIRDLKSKNINAEVELLIVDDTPDDSLLQSAIDHLADLHDFDYRVISPKANGGIHKARVLGIQHAQYEHVILLDQDDVLSAQALATQIMNIQDYDVAIANGFVERDGKHLPIFKTKRSQDFATFPLVYFTIENVIVSPGQCLIRKRSIPKAWKKHIVTKNGSDDYFLWLLMFEHKARFTLNYEPVYIHRDTGANISLDREVLQQSTLSFVEIIKEKHLLSRYHQNLILRQIQYRDGLKRSKRHFLIASLKNFDLFALNVIYKLLLKGM